MDREWIEESVKSFVQGQMAMDPRTWARPNVWLMEPLFADLWLSKIREAKKIIEEKKISYEEIANCFVGPSHLRKEFRWAVWNMKFMGTNKEEIFEILDFYLKILETKTREDRFGLYSTFWNTDDELKEILLKTNWLEVDDELKKIVGRLSANSPPILWGLYSDHYFNFSYELLGLYKDLDNFNSNFKKEDSLMVRNYGPFKCPEFWDHTKEFPFSNLKIKCIYNNLQGHFDFINHFVSKDNIMSKLTHVSVEVDGREVTDLNELKRINEGLVKMALVQDEELSKLDMEEKKKLAVNSKFYGFKPFFDKLGMDWNPGEEIVARFENKEDMPLEFVNLDSQEKITQFWKEVFHPTLDFSMPELIEVSKWLQEHQGK